MLRSVVLAALAMACASSNHTPSGGSGSATTTGRADLDATTSAPMTTPTFTVRSDVDLAVPLSAAVAEADKAGADELVVRIAPGTYSRGLSLRAPTGDGKLKFTVEPEGTGRVVLAGAISIVGKRVSLRGVILDRASTPAIAVSLHAFESLELTNVAIVGTTIGSGGGERDPLVDLVARSRGATARVRDLWIVDSAAGNAALVRVPVNGTGRWASLELDNVGLVGNRAGTGIDVRATDALTIRNVFVVEPALATWLQVGTFGAITIDQSVIAVRELVAHLDSGDGTYPKVKVTRSELFGPRPSGAIDASETRWGKRVSTVDTKTAAASARAGTPPDRTALRAGLPQ
jgi:hypothetical protein